MTSHFSPLYPACWSMATADTIRAHAEAATICAVVTERQCGSWLRPIRKKRCALTSTRWRFIALTDLRLRINPFRIIYCGKPDGSSSQEYRRALSLVNAKCASSIAPIVKFPYLLECLNGDAPATALWDIERNILGSFSCNHAHQGAAKISSII